LAAGAVVEESPDFHIERECESAIKEIMRGVLPSDDEEVMCFLSPHLANKMFTGTVPVPRYPAK